MKKITLFTLACICFLAVSATGQSLSHSVIGSAGEYQSNGNVSLSFTVGETFTETFSGADHTLTQGFQQPFEDEDDVNQIFGSQSANLNIAYYPNPVRQEVNVNITSDVQSDYELTLHTITGQQLEVNYEKKESGNNLNFVVAMNYLPEGVYMLRIVDQTSGEAQTAKLTKVK